MLRVLGLVAAAHSNALQTPAGSTPTAFKAEMPNNSMYKPSKPLPNLPQLPPMRTCAWGSPAYNMSFCDQALSHEQRAALLASELTEEERVTLWALHSYHYPIERLNIKGLHRDTCCVHGPALNFFDGSWTFPPSEEGTLQPRFVSVFPHAINHGAMFDLDLVARLANATGNEMRAASQIRYRTSEGQAFAAIICDSGPLANTAHHPAWGRISETYGALILCVRVCGFAW